MKKTQIITLVFLLTFILVLTGLAFADMHITIKIDGKEIASDVEPQLIQNRTLVPIRVITESMGADVNWIQESQTVDIVSPYEKFMNTYAEEGMYIKQAADILPLFKEGKAIILDVRSNQLRSVSYIKDSLFIPMAQLLDNLTMLPKDKIIAVYCAKNINASYAVSILNMLDYDAYVLENGMTAWKAAGGEITECGT